MNPAMVLQTTPTAPEVVRDGLSRPAWLPDIVPGWLFRIVIAVALVVVAYYVAKVGRQVLGRRIARRFRRPSISQTILRLVQVGIVGLGIIAALSVLGLGFGNVALSVGIFSAVVGIILAPIIGTIINGVFILSEQPYEIGDMIELEDTDTRGFVEDITLLYTKMFTLDNTFIVMPNGEMRARDVINYSAEDTRTRLTLDVDVTYESDVPEARALLETAAQNVEEVISGGPDIRIGSARYPASPTAYIREFGDHGITIRLRYWAREPYKLTTVESKVQTNAWEQLTDADVEIPYPHSHLVFDDTSGEMQIGVRETIEERQSRDGEETMRAGGGGGEGGEADEGSMDSR